MLYCYQCGKNEVSKNVFRGYDTANGEKKYREEYYCPNFLVCYRGEIELKDIFIKLKNYARRKTNNNDR